MARRRVGSRRVRRSNAAKDGRRVLPTQAAHLRRQSAGTTSRFKLRARQHAAIAVLGERALAGLAPSALMDTAVRALAEVLEVELAHVLELQQGGALVAMRAGVGWKAGTVDGYSVPTEQNAHARYTLSQERPVIVTDMARDARFAMPELLARHAVVSGMSAVIRSREAPFGIIGVYSPRRRRFSEHDASVLASAANILGMAIDRDRADAELRHYRDLLEGVTDTIPVALAYADTDCVYRWVNRRRAERQGCTREAIVGKSMRELLGERYWSDVLEGHTRRVLAGETVMYERTAQNADGSRQQIEIHLTPSFGPDGRAEGFCVLAIDVTERQRAREALQSAYDELELRVCERTGQLAAAHRQAETLSYSIAHDLRAPLRAISGYARILAQEMATEMPAAATGLLERIGVNAERMGTLIDALLSFGQLSRQPLEPAMVRLDDVVEDALGWMQNELDGRRIEVERHELGEVRADPALVRIAVANLISNAIKFSRGRDPARIEIGRLTADAETIYFVRDNGAGFDMRYADKLFGMFQRLHGTSRFEGSGVGLASVQQIVNRHGGRIWAESVEGAGATFYFTLGHPV